MSGNTSTATVLTREELKRDAKKTVKELKENTQIHGCNVAEYS